MTAKSNLRSAEYTVQLNQKIYKPIDKFPGNQIPTGSEVIERLMQLFSQDVGHQYSQEDASKMVSQELINLYIETLNIYPKTERNVTNQVSSMYDEFRQLRKYPKSKRGNYFF